MERNVSKPRSPKAIKDLEVTKAWNLGAPYETGNPTVSLGESSGALHQLTLLQLSSTILLQLGKG